MQFFEGDSGGPLISYATESKTYYHIIGIASYNSKCQDKYPDVYTRVTGKYFINFVKNIFCNDII